MYNTSLFKLDNNHCNPLGKTCSNKGGLIIYFNEKVNYRLYQVKQVCRSETYECQFIEIGGPLASKNIVLDNVYRPPTDKNMDYKSFIEEFSTSLTELINSNSELIIAGNFIINLMKLNEN